MCGTVRLGGEGSGWLPGEILQRGASGEPGRRRAQGYRWGPSLPAHRPHAGEPRAEEARPRDLGTKRRGGAGPDGESLGPELPRP